MSQQEEQDSSGSVSFLGTSKDDPSFLEYVSLIGSLLDPFPIRDSKIGDRMVGFINGKTCFTIVLAETADSLVIAHPATLMVNEEESLSAKLMIPQSMTRVMKSAVSTITPPTDAHRYAYLKFLLSEVSVLPQVFEGARLESIKKFLAEYELLNVESSFPLTKPSGEKASYTMADTPRYQSKLRH